MKKTIYDLSSDDHDIKKLVFNLKNENKKIVFTNGCFDILHIGHLRYLQKAKDLGDVLLVGLNSDESVKKIKKLPRPFVQDSQRAELLAGLKPVDYVFIFYEPTPIELVKIINPDFLVKGGDWDINKIVGASHVQSYGGRVLNIEFEKGHSTTDIVNKILTSKDTM